MWGILVGRPLSLREAKYKAREGVSNHMPSTMLCRTACARFRSELSLGSHFRGGVFWIAWSRVCNLDHTVSCVGCSCCQLREPFVLPKPPFCGSQVSRLELRRCVAVVDATLPYPFNCICAWPCCLVGSWTLVVVGPTRNAAVVWCACSCFDAGSLVFLKEPKRKRACVFSSCFTLGPS